MYTYSVNNDGYTKEYITDDTRYRIQEYTDTFNQKQFRIIFCGNNICEHIESLRMAFRLIDSIENCKSYGIKIK